MKNESHSIAANDITVLGAGPSEPVIFERPTSSGRTSRRSTTPKRLQRSGSSLEVLPNELETSTVLNPTVRDNQQTTVANSDSRPSSRSSKKTAGDLNSLKINYSDSAHKKVILPSVKRDFEKHGMPNNEEFEAFVRSTTPTLKDLQTEQKILSTISSLETGIRGIQLETNSSTKTDSVKNVTTLNNDYYLSHHSASYSDELPHSNPQSDEKTKSATDLKQTSSKDDKIEGKNHSIKQVTTLSDDYYVSHSQSDSHKMHKNSDENGKKENTRETVESLKIDDDESSEESDDEDEEKREAPIELLSEFLDAVMEEDFENAQKLCQMILIYEPDNKEANEFKPLIDEELRKERERQLWGSSSEEESSEDEDSDDETDDSDDEDDDDDDDDDKDGESNDELDSDDS